MQYAFKIFSGGQIFAREGGKEGQHAVLHLVYNVCVQTATQQCGHIVTFRYKLGFDEFLYTCKKVKTIYEKSFLSKAYNNNCNKTI